MKTIHTQDRGKVTMQEDPFFPDTVIVQVTTRDGKFSRHFQFRLNPEDRTQVIEQLQGFQHG